jgi:hypothetical protein
VKIRTDDASPYGGGDGIVKITPVAWRGDPRLLSRDYLIQQAWARFALDVLPGRPASRAPSVPIVGWRGR